MSSKPPVYRPSAGGPCYDDTADAHTPAAQDPDYSALPRWLSPVQQKRVYLAGFRGESGAEARALREYHLTRHQYAAIVYEGWFYGWGYLC